MSSAWLHASAWQCCDTDTVSDTPAASEDGAAVAEAVFNAKKAGTKARRVTTRQPWHNPALDVWKSDAGAGEAGAKQAATREVANSKSPLDSMTAIRLPFGE